MRRISRRLIREVAESLMSDVKSVSQHVVHQEIEKRIGRGLTRYEKSRITLILRENYSIVRIERRGNARIVYFQ